MPVDFSEVLRVFDEYRQKRAPRCVGHERERADEAAVRLRELQTLARRVDASFAEACKLQELFSERMIEKVRESAKDHPDLTEYFEKNPTVKLETFMKVWTAGSRPFPWGNDSEVQRPVELERDMETANAVYINYTSDQGNEIMSRAYLPSVRARLTALKSKYDRTNLFSMNHNIKPDVVGV